MYLILGQDGSDIKVNDWIVSQKFENTCKVKLTNVSPYEEGRFQFIFLLTLVPLTPFSIKVIGDAS